MKFIYDYYFFHFCKRSMKYMLPVSRKLRKESNGEDFLGRRTLTIFNVSNSSVKMKLLLKK